MNATATSHQQSPADSAVEGTVVIYGHNDDLIEVEGNVRGCDEYPAERATFLLTGDGAQVRVYVVYGPEGVWAVGAAPVAEDAPMLPVKLTGEGYTARAVIEGVHHVVRLHRDSDDD